MSVDETIIPAVQGPHSRLESFFCYSEYKKFLQHLASNAPVVRFADWRGERAILLRHDVDFSVSSARALAEQEREVGISSTFFFMTTCFAYNAASSENRRMLREMVAWGFEVGLHFDPLPYADAEGEDADMEAAMRTEAEILSGICGAPVSSVSLHNPTSSGLYPLSSSLRNAYDPQIFNDTCYLSDSCRSFRGKDPWTFALAARQHPIQMLFHPLHFSEDGGDYRAIFRRQLEDLVRRYDRHVLPFNLGVREVLPSGFRSYLV